MSLYVDTKNISKEIEKLDNYINEYIENSQDVYLELSKLDSYWKDTNSVKFADAIRKEKNNSLLVIESLNKISKYYKMVEEFYNKS